jgi:hypothetical protein
MEWQSNRLGASRKIPSGEFVIGYFPRGPIRYALVRWECGKGWKDVCEHSMDAPDYVLILEHPPKVE